MSSSRIIIVACSSNGEIILGEKRSSFGHESRRDTFPWDRGMPMKARGGPCGNPWTEWQKEKEEKERMWHKRAVHTPFATIRSTIRSPKYRLIDSPERLHKLSCSLSLKEPWPKCQKRSSRKLFDKASKHRSDCIRTCLRTCAQIACRKRAQPSKSRPRSRTWTNTALSPRIRANHQPLSREIIFLFPGYLRMHRI